jgi:hypothetical protein
MSEALSEQIGAFRRTFGRYVDDGVCLSGEAVEAFDGLFASFQAQAKLLEGGGPPDFETMDAIYRAAAAEAEAISNMAKRLEATTAKLRLADVIPFRRRGDVA